MAAGERRGLQGAAVLHPVSEHGRFRVAYHGAVASKNLRWVRAAGARTARCVLVVCAASLGCAAVPARRGRDADAREAAPGPEQTGSAEGTTQAGRAPGGRREGSSRPKDAGPERAAASAKKPLASNAPPPPRLPCRPRGEVIVRRLSGPGDGAFFRLAGATVSIGAVIHRRARAAVSVPGAVLEAGRSVCRRGESAMVAFAGPAPGYLNRTQRVIAVGIVAPRAPRIAFGQPVSLSLEFVVQPDGGGPVRTLVLRDLSGVFEPQPQPP